MISVSLKELWMLLGEKDVQIYQLLKEKEADQARINELEEEVKSWREADKDGGLGST